MSSSEISPFKSELNKCHDFFSEKARRAGLSTGAACFLAIGALIVITCGCICLTLPGINVISSVILPAVIPGAAALTLSIPFIVLSVKYARAKNAARAVIIEKIIKKIYADIQDNQIPLWQTIKGEPEKDTTKRIAKVSKKHVKYLKDNFLNDSWDKGYQTKLMADLKKEVSKRFTEEDKKGGEGKKANKSVEIFLESFDKVQIEINKIPKKS